MKRTFKMLAAAFSALLLTGCVSDDDTSLAPHQAIEFAENFNTGTDNAVLEIKDWYNYAEKGKAVWRTQVYQSNGYAEFSSYSSGDPVNIGWLISPTINVGNSVQKKLALQIAQSYVTTSANKIEVLISTDYTDQNVADATWTLITDPNLHVPDTKATYFEFIDSKDIDLSAYTGTITLAFKVSGGTGDAIDGSYQIDNVRVY